MYNAIALQRLNVRSQMDTRNDKNILRTMSQGEGFTVYQVYTVPGPTGLQKWARISDNPGDVRQEYACLSIGNKTFAKREAAGIPEFDYDEWARLIAWARSIGYDG